MIDLRRLQNERERLARVGAGMVKRIVVMKGWPIRKWEGVIRIILAI